MFISETRSWVRNYKAIVLPLCCHLFIQIVFISSLSFFFSLPLDETRPISRHETRHFSQLIVVTNHFISINRVSIPYLDVARQLSDLRAIPPWMEIQLRENIESFPRINWSFFFLTFVEREKLLFFIYYTRKYLFHYITRSFTIELNSKNCRR